MLDILPTLGNLARRSVALDSCCPSCGRKLETSMHLFRECKVIREVLPILFTSNVAFVLYGRDLGTSMNHVGWVHLNGRASELDLLLVALWQIWSLSNQVVFQRGGISIPFLVGSNQGFFWMSLRVMAVGRGGPSQMD